MRLGASKVSGKLQITIPKEVVKRLRIEPGDYVIFHEEAGKVTVKRGKLTEG